MKVIKNALLFTDVNVGVNINGSKTIKYGNKKIKVV